MSNYTRAFNNFIDRLREIEALRNHADSLRPMSLKLDSFPSETSSICKGAILLLCGHIEAYFKELGELTIQRVQSSNVKIKELPKNLTHFMLIDKIDSIVRSYNKESYGPLMDKLINLSTIIEKNSNDFIESEYETKIRNIKRKISIPDSKIVERYFRRFGYNDFKVEFDKKHKENSSKFREQYNYVIIKRNRIAHGVDSDVYTPAVLASMESDVRIFCESVDSLFSDWCEQNLCPIR